jgi:hypothetical protein
MGLINVAVMPCDPPIVAPLDSDFLDTKCSDAHMERLYCYG